MDGLVDVFQHFHCVLHNLVLEVIVTVVLPDPVPTQFLDLFLPNVLLFLHLLNLRHLGLHFGILSQAE